MKSAVSSLIRCIPVIALLALVLVRPAFAQTEADRQAVYNAVLDYVEGLYQVQPERIERSVHPDLRKIGFWRPSADDAYRPGSMPMTFEQLVELAGRWNASGTTLREDAPKEIVIFEVADRTATAKLTAQWGIDYFHLAKFDDGTWKIINVLWQSPPDGTLTPGDGD